MALVPLLNLLSLVCHLVLFNLPDVETVPEDYSIISLIILQVPML